ncbi:hypothetical protein AGDE_16562 [Angomonas deanei]|nr:hypothetical protein AGDE_16562 [Angomonas deanei]|eukprot:EPY16877.1 hypothetical protein AGDE_16562 [Angomonas deanei]
MKTASEGPSDKKTEEKEKKSTPASEAKSETKDKKQDSPSPAFTTSSDSSVELESEPALDLIPSPEENGNKNNNKPQNNNKEEPEKGKEDVSSPPKSPREAEPFTGNTRSENLSQQNTEDVNKLTTTANKGVVVPASRPQDLSVVASTAPLPESEAEPQNAGKEKKKRRKKHHKE